MILAEIRTSPWFQIGMTALTGIALGLFSHASSALPGAWRWVGNFGALWLAVSFLLGRQFHSLLPAALSGAAALAVASVMHYVPHRMAREGMTLNTFRWPVALWAFVGIVVGAAFGMLGAAHARRWAVASTVGMGLLVAAFAGEAFVLWRTGHPRAVEVAVPLETIVALSLPIFCARSATERIKIFGSAVLMFPVVVLGLSAFMGVIHRVYPGI
ncbi:MAG: hypothetical protein QOG16_1482 [Actinomycetota bacterium]|nr:hypothetical protein [Actinomycetota bacterium]